MDIKAIEAMHKSVVEVFEQIAFANLEPIERIPDYCNGKNIVLADIEYTKPFHGKMRLMSDLDFIQEVAADMLGESEPQPPEVALESFKELMNILAGVFLKEYYGEDEETVFGIPKGLIIKYNNDLCKGWDLIAFKDDFDNHVAVGLKK